MPFDHMSIKASGSCFFSKTDGVKGGDKKAWDHFFPNYFSLLVNTVISNKGYFNIHKQILFLLKITFSFISHLLITDLSGRSRHSSEQKIAMKYFGETGQTHCQ